jgi:hypothetical protein
MVCWFVGGWFVGGWFAGSWFAGSWRMAVCFGIIAAGESYGNYQKLPRT